MASRSIALFFALLILTASSVAQQTACKAVEVPVGVIGINGDSFRGLAAEDFAGQAQKKPVAVKSLAFDDGPRRVLLVAESGKHLSNETRRKAEIELMQALIAASRPQDSFALLIARGPGEGVKFGEDRSTITPAFTRGGDSKHNKDAGVLDAVMEGIEWFGAPQPGDAIVVIAADMEGNHKANARIVAKALEKHQIRMFGLALGPVSARNSVASGMITSTTSMGLAEATPLIGGIVYNTGDEHFFPLTTNSGGLVLAGINMDSRRSYNMADPHVQQEVRQKARAVFNMISSFYRMKIELPQVSHPEAWTLDINESIRKHAPAMFVLYPHELGPC